MGEIKFTTSIVFVVLFTLAVIGYAVNFAVDNNTAISLSDDPAFSRVTDKIEGNVSLVRSDINESSTGFFNSQVETGDDMTKTGGQFKLGILGMVSMFGAVIELIRVKLLGGSGALGIFVTIFLAMMTYIAIRYIWKTWKGGNPD